jgi:hypothetical protein
MFRFRTLLIGVAIISTLAQSATADDANTLVDASTLVDDSNPGQLTDVVVTAQRRE